MSNKPGGQSGRKASKWLIRGAFGSLTVALAVTFLYLNKALTIPPQESPTPTAAKEMCDTPREGRIAADGTVVRDAANQNGNIVGYLSRGAIVLIIACELDWYKIENAQIKTGSGWVLKDFVNIENNVVIVPEPPKTPGITETPLSTTIPTVTVTSEITASSTSTVAISTPPIVTQLPDNVTPQVNSTQMPDALPSPVVTSTLLPPILPTETPQPIADAIVSPPTLKLFSGPSTTSDSVGDLSQWTELKVIGKTPECRWLNVITPMGIAGWVQTEGVTLNKECAQIPTISVSSSSTAKPDLVVSAFAAESSAANTIRFNYTITNRGTAPVSSRPVTATVESRYVAIHVFLSTESGDMLRTGVIRMLPSPVELAPGQSYSDSYRGEFTFVSGQPDLSSRLFLTCVVDWFGIVDESDEGNNRVTISLVAPPTLTPTPTLVPTNTPVPTATPSATATFVSTNTPNIPTSAPALTDTPSSTQTPNPTNTPNIPTSVPALTDTPSSTQTSSPTNTLTPTLTETATDQPSTDTSTNTLEQEPNDTYDTSNGPAVSGATFEGFHNDQFDFYTFYVDSAGPIVISLNSSHESAVANNNIQIALYYGYQSPETLVGIALLSPYTISYQAEVGWYFVRVFTDACCLDGTAAYQLSLSFPQSTPTPTNTPMPSPISTGQWCDNFNDGQLDQGRWLPSTNSSLVYEQDGVLNFRVTKEQSQAGNDWAELESILLDEHIRETTYTIALESYTGNVPGAAGSAVYLEDGRDFSVDVGPGPNGPGFEFSLCRVPVCSDYDDYYHPDGGAFPVGTRIPMKMTWTGESVKLYVNNKLRIEPSTNNNPVTGFLFYMYADPGSAFHVTVDDVCVIYAETATPTPTPTGTPTPTSQIGYNFETGIQNWAVSEGAYKYATIDTTKQVVYSGARGLRLTTDLRLDADEEVLRHTEVVAFFNNTIPEGITSSGPYSLMGNSVSCFVYLPAELAPSENSGAYIRLFVKDNSSRNQYTDPVNISSANVNRWLQLTLSVGSGGSIDSGFDSTKINALGVRIELYDGATLEYVGPLFIDHCAIEYP